MRKLLLMALLMFCCTLWAQDPGPNPIFSLEYQEASYEIKAQKPTAGKVLGTIASAAAGITTDTHHEDKVPAVNAAVQTALKHIRRFNPVDALMENEDGYLLTGQITNLTTTSQTEVHTSKDSKGKEIKKTTVRYDAVAEISLTLKEMISGSTSTQTFKCTAYSDGAAATADKALTTAIKRLEGKIAYYYNRMFPTHATIVERGNEKKDKQKEVYIDAGTTTRTYEDMHFAVYVIGQIAGRETKKEIGRLKVNEVLGEDISLCKVQKGGKDIKAALDEGKQIVVISID